MDEAGFLAGFASDAESRAVYADWLEESGHALRAQIVRAVDLLARTNRNHADVHSRALAVLDLGDRLMNDRAWLVRIGVGRSLANEIGRMFVEPRRFNLEFRDTTMTARFAKGAAITTATGTWHQIGPALRIELLGVEYSGFVIGSRVGGRIPRPWSFVTLTREAFLDNAELLGSD